jgi:methionyl-tRNA formyltransferase
MVNSQKSPKPSIVFFGNERLATGVTTNAPVLSALIEAGYQIEAVIVNHEQATSRKQRILEVEELAFEHDIPILAPDTKEALISVVGTLASPIAVLAAYGRIIPGGVIDHFKHGILNVHPSKLPLYRGSTPLESVILDGSESTTVSLMNLDVKMDAGAVYTQKDIVLRRTTSKQELANAAGSLGAQMIIEALPHIIDGTLVAQPQDESQATFTKQISKQDGKLNFAKSAEELEREVRAYAGWPGSSTEVTNKLVIVTEATVITESGEPGTFFVHDKQLAVYCGKDALLITQLKPASKNAMPSRNFLAGNPLS